jgi:hypothetical protein
MARPREFDETIVLEAASPGDLAKRFLELEQLRKQVRELEHLATIAR